MVGKLQVAPFPHGRVNLWRIYRYPKQTLHNWLGSASPVDPHRRAEAWDLSFPDALYPARYSAVQRGSQRPEHKGTCRGFTPNPGDGWTSLKWDIGGIVRCYMPLNWGEAASTVQTAVLLTIYRGDTTDTCICFLRFCEL